MHGQLIDVPAVGAHDHVCWVYRDEREFDAAALEFAAAGLARGERVLCVGDRVVEGLRRSPAALGDVDALIAEGALRTVSLAGACSATEEFDAERQRAFYDAATQEALDAGYRGLRILAELSTLAEDARIQPVLVRWEHVADEYIANSSGMTAMCAYRGDLPVPVLAEAAAGHPLVHAPGDPPAFQLFFDQHQVALTGDVDALGAEHLARMLASSPVVEGSTCVLDLSELRFADVAGCRAIARWARARAAHGVGVELRNAPPLMERAWHLLGFDEWAVVSFTLTA